MSSAEGEHIPVLLRETIENLRVQEGMQYIDASVGGGGHAEAIIKKGGRLLAIDLDPEAVQRTKQRLSGSQIARYKALPGAMQGREAPEANHSSVVTVGNFKDIAAIAARYGFTRPQGILFDLGVASFQLEDPVRGMSFLLDTPLDMRLDPTLKRTASQIVNEASEDELYEIFTFNAQEELARPIARALVRSRDVKPIRSTRELAQIVTEAVGGHKRKIHPATKVFLALRMETNQEVANLTIALPQAIDLLVPGGRLVVISFQESEDRIVKRELTYAKRMEKIMILSKRPITPSQDELQRNPRSRSARERVAQRR